MNRLIIQEIHQFFLNKNLNHEETEYVSYHAKRYGDIIQLIGSENRKDATLLDIGPAFQTMLIRNYFPEYTIDTLGFSFNKFEYRESEQHYTFDLNKSQNPSDWIMTKRKYDIIVFTEVIEHLHTSPALVLKFVHSLLNENGILILQTPNAVTLPYRILMLAGRNPYMLISEDANNHAHFREYTLNEMKTYLKGAGFSIVKAYRKNYFYRPQLVFKLFLFLCWFLPASFRQGLTVVAKR